VPVADAAQGSEGPGGAAGHARVSGVKKADLIDRIVSHTIGYRLSSSAIRQL
jgi:hypothetical protein